MTDLVGYVTSTYPIETENGPIYKPTQGNYDRTAGELIKELQSNGDDIGAVFGDYKEEAGAWIRSIHWMGRVSRTITSLISDTL